MGRRALLVVALFMAGCSPAVVGLPGADCSDGVQNQDEAGVDCGGPCAACAAAPTCSDGVQNQDETGIDCGGPCSACAAAPSCTDGVQNQGETGIDCGGPCSACVGPSCSDGLQNGGETGIDCGGPCSACPTGCTAGSTRAGPIACGVGRAGKYQESCVAGVWQTTSSCSAATSDRYVATTGSDTNTGLQGSPWRTLGKACSTVTANQGMRIIMAAGTYSEAGPCALPPGVDLIGAGAQQTVITGAATFHHPSAASYALDKFLVALRSGSMTPGNQAVFGIGLDGADKRVYGGLLLQNRSGLDVFDISVSKTYFTGVWVWSVTDARIHDLAITDCSWGSYNWCSGGLNLGTMTDVDLYNLTVTEVAARDFDAGAGVDLRGGGYGIKAIGPGDNTFTRVRLFDSTVSVHPQGAWLDGLAPNITIEWWSVYLVNSEITGCNVDNTISLVNDADPDFGHPSVRVHHNNILCRVDDCYPIELTNHRAEIDHNNIDASGEVIANWGTGQQFSYWNIHHNFIRIKGGGYPGTVVHARKGISHLSFANNTVELAHAQGRNILYVQGGAATDVSIVNNIVRRTVQPVTPYDDRLVQLNTDGTNTSTLSGLTVSNNIFSDFPGTLIQRGSYSDNEAFTDVVPANLTRQNNHDGVDPLWEGSGAWPLPYYRLQTASPGMNGGVDAGMPFSGSAPEIGAWEAE